MDRIERNISKKKTIIAKIMIKEKKKIINKKTRKKTNNKDKI
jgi:hypothetical protein